MRRFRCRIKGWTGQRCQYCRRTLEAPTSSSRVAATRDHVMPRSAGGLRTVLACFQCNNLKGDMLPDQWTAFMAANPEWWKQPQFQRQNLSRDQMLRRTTRNPPPPST